MNTNFSGGNAGSLFGGGVYFAEDIEKADQCVMESRGHSLVSDPVLLAGIPARLIMEWMNKA